MLVEGQRSSGTAVDTETGMERADTSWLVANRDSQELPVVMEWSAFWQSLHHVKESYGFTQQNGAVCHVPFATISRLRNVAVLDEGIDATGP